MQRKLEVSEAMPSIVRSKFVSARVLAEFVSRRTCFLEDVSLADIYLTMARSLDLPQEISEKLLLLELDIESKCIKPIRQICDRIQECRAEGDRIIFISDMYLPTKFIASQLARFGVLSDGDSVYVSGELGITKVSGKLFQHVLEQEDIVATQLIHCGDNPHSDVFVPKSLGLRLDPMVAKKFHGRFVRTSLFRQKLIYGFSLLRAKADLWW
jgi:predicted HAD superfamily hydrolase